MGCIPRIRTSDPEAEFISRVLDITPAIEAMAGGASSEHGIGRHADQDRRG